YLPPTFVGECALSPDGKLAASVGGSDGLHEAFIWQTADGKMNHRLAVPSWLRPGYETAWSPDGKSVAWGFPKGKTRPLLDLGALRLGTAASPGELHGPSLKEGALTLVWSPKPLYAERDVMKDDKMIARLGVPHRSHVPGGATFVGPERVALTGDW